MNYFKCINEVKPSYIIDTEPVFSETVLYENQTSTNENTITLSDDYSNYDIIKFYCYNPNEYYTQYTQYYITPTMLNHVVTYLGGYCCFNTPGTNQYTLYRVTSNTTLTYREARNMYPIKIAGLKCSNGSIVETKIFGKQVIDTNWSPIETQYNLIDDFNILLAIAGAGWDELNIIPQVYICANSKELNVVNDNDTQLTEWNVPYYNHNIYTKVSEHSISDNYWIYVAGLKFIPNWDYYIEDRILTGSDSINTGLLPWKDDDTKARSWEICFKIETTSENASGGYVTTGNNTTPGVWLTRNGSNDSYVFMLDNNYIYNDTLSNKDVKIVCNHEDNSNPYMALYVNGEKVLQKTENLSGYNTNRPIIIGAYSPYLSYFITGTVHYFGFRWLS